MLAHGGRRTAVKVSLCTRDPKFVLQLSHQMRYGAEAIARRGELDGMQPVEIKRLIHQHFKEVLERRKAEIDALGASAADRKRHQYGLAVAQQAVEDDVGPAFSTDKAAQVHWFSERHALGLQPGTVAYAACASELGRYYYSYHQGVLAHLDERDEDYSLGARRQREAVQLAAPPPPIASLQQSVPVVSLELVIENFIAEQQRGKRWAAKTQLDKDQYFGLLKEILGPSIDVRSVAALQARQVKDAVLRYPKNRNKLPSLRDLPLSVVLERDGDEKLATKTVNQYLQAYSGLFDWAKRNGYVDDNVFSGMTVQGDKRRAQDSRAPFSSAQLQTIFAALVDPDSKLVRKPYQKWGPLIAMYTGARLNEIAQLELSDIREIDGLWCIDLNDAGEDKSLKTEAARRIVPMHRSLIDAGLPLFVAGLRRDGQRRLFPDFSYCTKNGWGRNLGRWFNEKFLVELGIKSSSLVFHSFRHTMVTRLLQAGVAEPLVQSIVGHERAGVTQKHYHAGYTVKQMADALERFRPISEHSLTSVEEWHS
ncbi:MAG: hypothetical protein ABS35_35040 [Kaistia sp. SCN 65-12]|nr:MAG: hypothetical protein ABS35_35040 [Kaistia sp. SCN 65-12]